MQENNRYFDLETGITASVKRISELPKPVLALVAGSSCSGKGYTSKQLKKLSLLAGISVSIVRMDCCFKDIDDPSLPYHGDIPIYDIPESYQLEEIKGYVCNLMHGTSIDYPVFCIQTSKRVKGDFVSIKSADLIILDGLFAISELANLGFGSILKIFIHADESVRLKRLVKRNQRRHGISRKVTERVFMDRIAPLHRKYVEPQRKMADIVIANNLPII